MAYQTLLVEKAPPLLTVTLNRPDKLNAMNGQMLEELPQLFAELREDIDTKFVIFTGAGRAFTAGADLSDARRPLGGAEAAHTARLAQLRRHDFFRTLESLEQITIAAVNGVSLGAGLVLAMGCDFRIASTNDRFGVPESNVGVFFTWGSTPRLVSLIGPSYAKEIIMTCDMIDAEEAFRIGLVNKVVSPEQLMGAVHDLASKIGSKAPLAIRMTKKLVNAAAAPGIGDLYPCEPELVERLYLSQDTAEGTIAFREKRQPRFTGL